jgi:small GTP-binding protein
MSISERLKELEDELHRTQKNKATEYHIGILKSKIAKLRRELLSPKKLGGEGGAKKGFSVRKSGDATAVIVGMPSVGKSTLLTKLTNAESKIADYAFTTLECIPGMLEYEGAHIQLLDLPGIIEGAAEGRGRGKEIISVVRSADIIIILLDVNGIDKYELICKELESFGIRLNKKQPDIVIRKLSQGGITITTSQKLTKMSNNEIKAVLNEYGIYNANVVFRGDYSLDELIDVLEGNRVYVPAIVVVNKIDLKPDISIPSEWIAIAAENGIGIEALKKEIYKKLNFIKIYTKRRGEKADIDEPLIIKKGATVGDVCDKLHRELRNEFKFALVWGKSAKHQGQRVGIDHILEDGDIVQIIKK